MTFNNCPKRKSDTAQRILKCIKKDELLRSYVLAYRLGLSRATVSIHIVKLLDQGKLRRELKGGRWSYGHANEKRVSRRTSSVHYAGPRTIGRGLANW